jgi:hypothetical protein
MALVKSVIFIARDVQGSWYLDRLFALIVDSISIKETNFRESMLLSIDLGLRVFPDSRE